ncbi:hypothetical protein SB49_10770 [Sediminicola sp. YIK13]|nr:hypothetical protein SB49_10770 [Sediminicola sp. YIK13]
MGNHWNNLPNFQWSEYIKTFHNMKQNAMTNENKKNEKTRDLKKITRIVKIHDKRACSLLN